jgi:hypothetical protein
MFGQLLHYAEESPGIIKRWCQVIPDDVNTLGKVPQRIYRLIEVRVKRRGKSSPGRQQ